jgi:TPR repeat protein
MQKSAAAGDVNSQTHLGSMYGSGNGLPEDRAKAAQWYQKAAALGGFIAQSRLGDMYTHGEGVPQDDVLAYAWLTLASEQRASTKTTGDLETLRNTLTVPQYLEAQHLAYSWIKGRVLTRDAAR